MSSWVIDPGNGDYVMGANGAPQDVKDLTMPAYYRLKTKRGTWMYAPDANYGSTFHLQPKLRSTENASLFEAIGADALQPILDDGRASEITVEVEFGTRNAVGLNTRITDNQGQEEQITINPIGVG